MSAGQLRHRIIFEKRTAQAADAYGNERGAFSTQFTVWAGITPRFAGEEVQAARLAGKSIVTIRVRKSSETDLIKSDWRGRHADTGEIYNVRSIVDLERPRGYREMLCETGVAT